MHQHPRIDEGTQNTKSNTRLRRVLAAMSIVTLLMSIPQVLTVWLGGRAQGVSIATWSTYFLSALLWFWFGLSKRDKNIYLPCIGWMIVDVLVVVGAIVYG